MANDTPVTLIGGPLSGFTIEWGEGERMTLGLPPGLPHPLLSPTAPGLKPVRAVVYQIDSENPKYARWQP